MSPHTLERHRILIEDAMARTIAASKLIDASRQTWFEQPEASRETAILAEQAAEALQMLQRSLGRDLSAILARMLARSAQAVGP